MIDPATRDRASESLTLRDGAPSFVRVCRGTSPRPAGSADAAGLPGCRGGSHPARAEPQAAGAPHPTHAAGHGSTAAVTPGGRARSSPTPHGVRPPGVAWRLSDAGANRWRQRHPARAEPQAAAAPHPTHAAGTARRPRSPPAGEPAPPRRPKGPPPPPPPRGVPWRLLTLAPTVGTSVTRRGPNPRRPQRRTRPTRPARHDGRDHPRGKARSSPNTRSAAATTWPAPSGPAISCGWRSQNTVAAAPSAPGAGSARTRPCSGASPPSGG
ncbi:23S rRNA pseudouridine2604 synthase [Jiangella alba]|uniref:23S rRNA pseudouridine2604 synthase n=1 Tax=Jiangella alba TaxID=561176 RepID=A0A1H5M884_9ACTN|nr:23S rRNA pseudouridine2604 synthase [Jiangella alba]